MTENAELSREELIARLEEVEASEPKDVEVATLSTRDRSPITPQDRKPKAELKDSKTTVVHGGESFEIDFDGIDDADLFGQDQNNPFVQAQAVKNVLGEEGYLKLCDLVRGEDGRAKMSAVQEAFGKIMQDASVKNS